MKKKSPRVRMVSSGEERRTESRLVANRILERALDNGAYSVKLTRTSTLGYLGVFYSYSGDSYRGNLFSDGPWGGVGGEELLCSLNLNRIRPTDITQELRRRAGLPIRRITAEARGKFGFNYGKKEFEIGASAYKGDSDRDEEEIIILSIPREDLSKNERK
jgi:hypothetical protein